MSKMILSSLWVMAVVLETPAPVSYDAAFVDSSLSSVLSYISCTTRKIQTHSSSSLSSTSSSLLQQKSSFSLNGHNDVKPHPPGLESWTLISTPEFGSRHKVPQENIPRDTEQAIKQTLLAEFLALTNIQSSADIQVKFSKLQLWGAAVPLNRHTSPYIIDGTENICICGDWFTSAAGGASIESAWCSGRSLGQDIIASLRASSPQTAVTARSPPPGHAQLLRDKGFESDQRFVAPSAVSHALGDVLSAGETPQSVSAAVVRGPLLNSVDSSDDKATHQTSSINSISGTSSIVSATVLPATTKKWIRKQSAS
jgi:hypothetical protein